MSVICKVTNVSKSFRPDFYKKPVQVLKNVNFQIDEGQFVGFIGPNGAGKTTTIKCMMQFIFPDKGDVSFFEQTDLIESKRKIGFLPERPYFQEFLSAMEFLKLHWNLSGLKKADFQKRADEVLEQVKLIHVKHKKLRDYSKGMLQRIGIAQALLASPEFLILDEPMSGLDPDGRILIKDILKNFKDKKMTVLMSSHLLEDVEELCDNLIILHKGETLFNGAISEFKHNFNSLEAAYKAFKGQIEEVNYNA
ncbi:MAG: ABC transporter ATP-binding protein [Bdellovibrionaceae bacterium]|nr:ABC transporter ATP-binding protein [Pseudobdellovibrionaceae bacterium]